MNILRAENITMKFGGVVAVDDFSFHVDDNEIVALIGPNGAGKTTVFNMVTGVYRPTSGKVYIRDENNQEHFEDITGKTPDKITKKGMARTFQNIRLFKEMTVLENVLVAKHFSIHANFISATLRFPNARKEEKRVQNEAVELLKRLHLDKFKDDLATSLPYGLQRHLEIARALATSPRLLLLDEPAAGMNPQETVELTHFIRQIKDEYNLSIFMIEHHMDLIMDISERIYVLNFGKLISHGSPEVIQNDPVVIEAYLGGDIDAKN